MTCNVCTGIKPRNDVLFYGSCCVIMIRSNYSGRDAHLMRGCDPPTWLVERGVTFHALLRQRRALLFRVPEQ